MWVVVSVDIAFCAVIHMFSRTFYSTQDSRTCLSEHWCLHVHVHVYNMLFSFVVIPLVLVHCYLSSFLL